MRRHADLYRGSFRNTLTALPSAQYFVAPDGQQYCSENEVANALGLNSRVSEGSGCSVEDSGGSNLDDSHTPRHENLKVLIRFSRNPNPCGLTRFALDVAVVAHNSGLDVRHSPAQGTAQGKSLVSVDKLLIGL